jgi:hypothetical protein
MWEDEIVAEVRRVRESHAERFDYNLNAIYHDLKKQEKESKRELVSLPSKPAIPVEQVLAEQ